MGLGVGLRRSLVVGLALGAAAATGGLQAAEVGVSVQFSEPGVYGRVDIGPYGPPQVILATPVIAEPPPMPPPVPLQPIYLWVPPEHQQHWSKYCRQYHACGHPVYFVHHDWYQQHVMAHPHGEDHHGYEHHGDGYHGDEHGHDQGHDRDERGRDDHERDR